MTIQKNLISNKFLATILAGIVTTMFGGGLVLYYLGFFSQVVIESIQAPAYRMAYLPRTGPYDKIGAVIKQVASVLEQAGVKTDTPFALLMDDTGKIKPENLRSQVGYLLANTDPVPESLQQAVFPARPILRVRFSGGKLLGSYKAYQGMKDWAKDHGSQLLLPALELYHPHQATEYQLGIRKLP